MAPDTRDVGCEATVPIRSPLHGTFWRQCSREASSFVCGIALCWQHFDKVVEDGPDGKERLSRQAEGRFAEWGVRPRAPFAAELICVECGATAPPDARGWKTCLTVDGEVAHPGCAEREFSDV